MAPSDSRLTAFNIAWLSSERVFRLVIQLAAGIAVIRHLGPERFGIVTTVTSVILGVVTVETLGIGPLIMTELARKQEPRDSVLGRALKARSATALLGTIVLGVLTLASSWPANLGFALGILTVAFVPIEVFRFEADLERRSRSYVRRRLIILACAAVLQLALVWSGADTSAFLVVITLSSALTYLVSARVIDIRSARRLLRVQASQSWLKSAKPFMVTTVALGIYLRIDAVMLALIADNREVGLYGAAVQISEFPYFVPYAIVASTFGAVAFSSSSADPGATQRMLDLTTGACIIAGAAIALAAQPLVEIAFGAQYLSAVPVLQIHILALPFVGWITARTHWLAAGGQQRHAAMAAVLGAVSNILLNLWLIPALGALGAAWATLASYGLAAYGYSLIVPATRPFTQQIHRSLARWPRSIWGFLLEASRTAR